ncbi:VOC family protein [Qipengyuania qiaonensis]|uniref:VOC family protein n=1 Tax=Qipengyuania qiaonensis TaxID=2867240 RepID=A0ABS7J9W9_9SPHN|nr:VOC family protein [Qipengyuania qiaonensis]MBX7484119.1 VOC family protein [Qipengyuania qiaonensis]
MPVPGPVPAHVVYRTRRMVEMLTWYETVFGAKPVYRNEALAFLAYDEDHHRFAIADLDIIAPGGRADDRGTIGVDHVAYDVSSMRDLLEAWSDLKQAGITPYWCVNHGMSASLYYADPDSNQLEFSVDCFAAKSDCSAYFAAMTADTNPVGVEFDPADWLERLRAGEDERALLAIDPEGDVSPIRGALQTMIA